MPFSPPSPALSSDTAVLLVLLAPASEAQQQTHVAASLRALQRRLGTAVRVMKIDEARHPTVVRSFGTPELPACVLVRQGVELWRQQGLPEDEASVTRLLAAAGPA
ncbi:thioredoxin [Hymenobacter lutimineralis]|uniref:Thioredoxin n=1 Tax=Hymenobacter lutimineralis TaxID=2606448 RepID=A0A5D6UT85_9BACT|nr:MULTISPECIES: thioredoxin [Hymenobacter]QIX62298.1 thioredoxin [Hymenobacter sp. BT18]TYZ06921.1 thioredoxin [Hymenobacter lutimineralis]